LGSLKAQVKTVEEDLKQFKDVNKKYTDQLIKVKVTVSRLGGYVQIRLIEMPGVGHGQHRFGKICQSVG
jgi:hypothetical protein